MKKLTALSLTTGILCGIWIWLSSFLGIPSWAGFAGCTAFFAAGGQFNGFKKAIATTLVGVFWAMTIITISNYINIVHIGAISTAVITFVMCYQANISLFSFIPGTFIGSFSTFASQGNWKLIVPALILGVILGFICESSGDHLFETLNENEQSTANAEI